MIIGQYLSITSSTYWFMAIKCLQHEISRVVLSVADGAVSMQKLSDCNQ